MKHISKILSSYDLPLNFYIKVSIDALSSIKKPEMTTVLAINLLKNGFTKLDIKLFYDTHRHDLIDSSDSTYWFITFFTEYREPNSWDEYVQNYFLEGLRVNSSRNNKIFRKAWAEVTEFEKIMLQSGNNDN